MQSNNKVGAAKDHFIESYNMPPPPPYSPTAPPVSPPSANSFPTASASTSYNASTEKQFKPPIPAEPVLYPALPLPPNDSTVYVTSTSKHSTSTGPQAYPHGTNFGGAAVVGSQHPQTRIHTVALTYAGEVQMSTYRQQVVCPYCKVEVTTNTTHRIGMLNHLSAVAACWMALCCCACIPYFVKGLKDVEHYCPICGRMLGVHRKLNF
ncbi:unnamed protein product [Orchesella dallaii]|uniref:LITAF domain-containing protein n=1 Tax=Orchesella dallaii TaxID=48710 RepID=A0ABP1QE59_9HEXA